ncbi:MAG: CPBP family intramembrane glutamic endopeptidase [Rubrivivax sp.]
MKAGGAAFPTIPQAALLILAGFLLQVVLGAALHDHRRALDLGEHELDALVTLLANGLLLATTLHLQGRSHRDLVHASGSSILATAVLLVPPVLLLVPLILHLDHALIDLLEHLFPLSRWEEQAFSRMVAGSIGTVVATCVLAPVLEEMLFRGVLLSAFMQQHPRGVAIPASALYFGAAHLNIYQFVLAFLLGLLLGWLYERSRSLIPCMALHGALNAWVMAAAHGSKAQTGSQDGLTLASWLGAVVAALAGAWLLRRMLGRSRPSRSI